MVKSVRAFCWTLHNWTEAERDLLLGQPCRYVCCGEECCPNTGRPHLQGYIYFATTKTPSAAVKVFTALLGHGRTHLEPAGGDITQNREYCSKDAKFHERGTPPMTDAQKGENEKQRAKRNLEAVMDGRLEDVDIDILTTQLQKYEYGAAKLAAARRGRLPPLDGVLPHLWIYGAAGVGKDQYALSLSVAPYLKDPSTKWWCGYNYENDVICRDVGKSVWNVFDAFKLWTDRYPFRAEIKGGSLGEIRPRRLIATSNYSLEELFGKDPQLLEPFMRRFQVVHLVDGVANYLPRVLVDRPPLAVRRDVELHDPPSPNRFTSSPERF